MFETFIPECLRGNGDESDFLLKGCVKQEADHKGSRAEYGLPLQYLHPFWMDAYSSEFDFGLVIFS